MWGLNYRRIPLEQKLDYDQRRITRDAGLASGEPGGHRPQLRLRRARTPARVDLQELSYDFWDAESKLGGGAPTVLGVPKRSLLTLVLPPRCNRRDDGSVFLEIIVNPDVLDIERPMVVAHEWGASRRVRERSRKRISSPG